MQTLFHLPPTLPEDLNRLREEVERFKNGSISQAEFRAFRVPQGIYEQRKEGTHMLRVRFPAGGVLPHQMRALARVSRQYGNGVLHVTTRQDIQVHDVLLDSLHPALVELYEAGLSTKGGGGNTVRNIVACFDTGVCPLEAFDVAPHAVALTEFLLSDPLSYQLPRKFKIAFSACAKDCAAATVNDVGFIAKRRGAEPGFAVYVGGGLGAFSRIADPLEEFVPVDEVPLVTEAIKRVFDQHGNRKNKRKARLRFLIDGIGLERFRALYEAARSALRYERLSRPPVRDFPRPDRPVPENGALPHGGFAEWRERNVVPQKQSDYYLVHIVLPLGHIPAETLEPLADVVEVHGEGMVRTTPWQNLVIRWVHENELPLLHGKLLALGLAEAPAPILRHTIACAGASTCKLGLCLSRGLARAVIEKVSADGLDLDQLGELKIHISGCPNACGRHPVGDIGLYGAARRVDGRLVPHYVIQLGGRVAEGKTRLAQGNDALPARNVPAFLADFLRAFQSSPQHPNFEAFLENGGRETARQLAAQYQRVPSFEEDKNYYFDWGAEALFSLAGRGPGECGAGVFDLIEVDLDSARAALQEEKWYSAAALAARALLVTQGQEARGDAQAFELFARHFIDTGLVPESVRALIEKGHRCALAAEPEAVFSADPGEVAGLVETVQNLYDRMDPSLRFRPEKPTGPPWPETARSAEGKSEPEPEAPDRAAQPEKGSVPAVAIDREADFHGVVCPLNFVKTKLLLEQMAPGQVLSVLLDSEGARNVPQSVAQEGHAVLSVTPEGERWRVLIRKA